MSAKSFSPTLQDRSPSSLACRSPSTSLEYRVSCNDTNSPDRRTVHFEDVLAVIGMHRKQWLIIMMCCLLYAHGTVGTLTLTLATNSMWEHWPELKDRPLFYNSIFAISNGMRLISSILFLPLMDRLGRRYFCAFVFFVSLILGPISGFAPDFSSWVVIRVLITLTATNLTAAAMVYNFELVACTRRAVPAILTQTAGCLFIVFATLLNGSLEDHYGDESWRYLAWFVNVPQAVTVILMCYTWLETPRFDAVVRGRTENAWETLVWLSPGGEGELRDGLGIVSEDGGFKDHLILSGDRSEMANPPKTSFWVDIGQSLSSQYTLATNKQTRGKMLWLCIVWFLQSFSHWGLVTYMTVFYKEIGLNVTWTTAGSFIVQLPAQAILYWLMQAPWSGRVRAMQVYFFCCAAMHGVLSILVASQVRNPTAMTIAALMCFFFGGPIWAPLYAYTTESWPTTQRSAGVGLPSAVAAIANIATTYAGSVSVTSSTLWSYPLIWGSLRFVACICCFFLKHETKNSPLDERLFGDERELSPVNASKS